MCITTSTEKRIRYSVTMRTIQFGLVNSAMGQIPCSTERISCFLMSWSVLVCFQKKNAEHDGGVCATASRGFLRDEKLSKRSGSAGDVKPRTAINHLLSFVEPFAATREYDYSYLNLCFIVYWFYSTSHSALPFVSLHVLKNIVLRMSGTHMKSDPKRRKWGGLG